MPKEERRGHQRLADQEEEHKIRGEYDLKLQPRVSLGFTVAEQEHGTEVARSNTCP